MLSLTSLNAQSSTSTVAAPDSTTKLIPGPDTNKVYFSLLELRTISDYMKELEYRRTQDSLYKQQISIYESVMIDFNNKEKMYLQKVDNLEKEVKAATPPWWDHFWIGNISGVAITGGVIYAVTRILSSVK